MQSILASWRRQSPAIRLLRAFLGLTFIYAGWHKASDPHFIGKGFADSVGAFASSSPISQFLDIAANSPDLFAWGIIVAEIGVGLFTLVGLAPLLAALAGMGLALTLWLASSWNVRPFFLAADPAYLALWSVYALAVWDGRPRSRRPAQLDRRSMLRGVGGAIGIGAIALLGRRLAGTSTTSKTGTPKSEGVLLDEIEIGKAAPFDSSTGPAVVIRTGANEVVAFSTKCTHEGCTVAFAPDRSLLVCPCHGATFDPRQGGAPTAPAQRPLPGIKVRINDAGRIVEG